MYNTALLKKRLRQLKLTQKQVALSLGVNVTTLNNYFNNQRSQPIDITIKLSKLLGIESLNEFYDYFNNCDNDTMCI